MYQPRLFREENRERLHDLVERHSFGMLMVATPGAEVDIAHVPFVLDRQVGEHGRLRLHVAKANPIWKRALAAGRVTAVFTGPHGYVSAGWYEKPSEQVPTWNYAVVHAHGAPRKLERDELVQLLDDLVAANEGGAEGAWSSRRLAPELRDELLLQIVGLSIDIATLEGKLKLSQNRSPTDHARVVEGLRARGRPDDRALVDLITGGGPTE
ncbi:FMN-binding negative transcriptional regulator [soil metagenome]